MERVNFEAKEWRIPAHKTKMKSTHIVPLSQQSLNILKELYQLTRLNICHGVTMSPKHKAKMNLVIV